MARATGPTPRVRETVYARDHHLCVRCGVSSPLTIQHRVGRGMGGSRAPWINQTANLITLCGSGTTGCHGWTEAHPTAGDAHGWSVPYVQDAQMWGVWTWQGWRRIDDRGQAWAAGADQLIAAQRRALDGCECGCLHEMPGFFSCVGLRNTRALD